MRDRPVEPVVPEQGLAYAMDATGHADLKFAIRTWEAVANRYAEGGVRLGKPVSLVIEPMPIMGATESTKDGHRLHVADHAVRSRMLDGLIAHEIGHMALAEQGHPSHRADVHRRLVAAVDLASRPRAFGGVVRGAMNHVQDVYADDLAIEVIGDDRASRFFSDWIRSSATEGPSRWATLGNLVSVAFALGNLARRGIPPEDGMAARAQGFAAAVGLDGLLPRLVEGFRDLPKTDETEAVERAMARLLTDLTTVEARGSGPERHP